MNFQSDDSINNPKYTQLYTIACLGFFGALFLIVLSAWLYLRLITNKDINKVALANTNLFGSGIGFGSGRLITQTVGYPISRQDINTLEELEEEAEDFSNSSSLPNYRANLGCRSAIIEMPPNCVINEDYPPAYKDRISGNTTYVSSLSRIV